MSQPYPPRVPVEGIEVDAFDGPQSLFERVRLELDRPGVSRILHLNVHGANVAADDPAFASLLREAEVCYCDGAGIVLGARLAGQHIPTRMTAADWLEELLADLARHGRTAFFLAGEPGVAERALQRFDRTVPGHSVVGVHHGYVLRDAALERRVIDEINRLRPDVLFVGMGMPLQERWIAEHRGELNVGAAWALGATLDYLTGKLPRSPDWMNRLGLEWLFRLGAEPRRLFGRYVVGNPRFLARVAAQRVRERA